MDVDVTLETGARIFAGIHDQPATAADAHVFAAGTVAGFAAADLREFDVIFVKSAVHAGGEESRDVRVTIGARGVADEVRAWNVWRRDRGALESRAGNE